MWLFLLVVILSYLKDLSFLLCFSPRTTKVPIPDRICHSFYGRHSATQVWSHWGAYANNTLAKKPTRPDSYPRRFPSGGLALWRLADQQTSTGGHWNLSMLSSESRQLKNRKWSRSQNSVRYDCPLYFLQNYILWSSLNNNFPFNKCFVIVFKFWGFALHFPPFFLNEPLAEGKPKVFLTLPSLVFEVSREIHIFLIYLASFMDAFTHPLIHNECFLL